MTPQFTEDHRVRLNSDSLQATDMLPQALLLPPGYTGLVFEPEQAPDYVQQTVTVEDVDAFETYLDKMVTIPGTLAIYVATGNRKVLAVLDHAADDCTPGRNTHRVELPLNLSAEFAPLHAVLGKKMTQEEMIDFLDQHSHLFVEAARLQQMVSTFQNVTVTAFKSVKNLDNGTSSLLYETAEDGGADASTKLPNTITAKMPVFAASQDADLALRLRYSTTGGKLSFQILLFGIEKLLRDEVLKIEARLRVWLSSHAAPVSTHVGKDVPVDVRDWSQALMVRAAWPSLPTPTPSKWEEHRGTNLPAGLVGGGLTVNASGKGY